MVVVPEAVIVTSLLSVSLADMLVSSVGVSVDDGVGGGVIVVVLVVVKVILTVRAPVNVKLLESETSRDAVWLCVFVSETDASDVCESDPESVTEKDMLSIAETVVDAVIVTDELLPAVVVLVEVRESDLDSEGEPVTVSEIVTVLSTLGVVENERLIEIDEVPLMLSDMVRENDLVGVNECSSVKDRVALKLGVWEPLRCCDSDQLRLRVADLDVVREAVLVTSLVFDDVIDDVFSRVTVTVGVSSSVLDTEAFLVSVTVRIDDAENVCVGVSV
jgi:hypothetical protein